MYEYCLQLPSVFFSVHATRFHKPRLRTARKGGAFFGLLFQRLRATRTKDFISRYATAI